VPVGHVWKVVCREPDLRADQQIAHTLSGLRPGSGRIAELAGRLAEDGGGAVLQVVRYFTHQDQSNTPDAPNLFGWHLDRSVLGFLTVTGSELDIDCW
jgi:hypothetical protein